jgi:hypothetical protein
MFGKIRTPLLSLVVACFASQANAAVLQLAGDRLAPTFNPATGDLFVEAAYHDMGRSLPNAQTSDAGAFKRGELRIDRNLNCFLAGSGDLICFSASLNEKIVPSQSISQEDKLSPARNGR